MTCATSASSATTLEPCCAEPPTAHHSANPSKMVKVLGVIPPLACQEESRLTDCTSESGKAWNQTRSMNGLHW
eukprot:8270030-Alexandrium_andersonii.AAC.1